MSITIIYTPRALARLRLRYGGKARLLDAVRKETGKGKAA